MSWWLNNNLRMIQNNIRDIDATMDIDKHIATLLSFGANVLQIGCGGITAFHPSKLECQFVNPYMKGDFFGDVIGKCHANGIRVIARFDFSKTHDSFYEKHPDWYSRRSDGSPIRYHDTLATCVNGAYQRRHSLEIIGEVIRKYPVDGIFFNMFGYITHDYSGNHVGICQCDNCKARFLEKYGAALPTVEDAADPIFRKYEIFKKETVAQQLLDIQNLVRSVSPDIAVSTYAFPGVDIVRTESNSAIDRPLPFWIYASTDNVGAVEGSYEDKISSNVAINAVDLPYRFMGVSKHLNQIRLYGNMAAGSGLDWCIIGNFEEYPDCGNFETTKDVFRFHKLHEECYGRLDPRTRIILVRHGSWHTLNKEYRGVFRMLKEEHIQFTVVDSDALEGHIPAFGHNDFIVLPDVPSLSEPVVKALASTSACVIATGGTLLHDADAIQMIFDSRCGEMSTRVRGTYMRTEPATVFPDFAKQHWVFLDQPYRTVQPGRSAAGLLPKVERAMYGPPERCFGHTDTNECLAAVGNGNILVPWNIAGLFYQYGYDEFKRILLDMMRSVRPIPHEFETNAPEMVEMFFAKSGASAYMLQLVNLTGFNGATFFESLSIPDIRVHFLNIRPKSIEELTASGRQAVATSDTVHVGFKRGELYKSFLVRV